MSQPNDNWLLLSLPETDCARLKAELQRVRLEKGRPLYRPGEKTDYAYFPLDCLVSTVYITPHTAAAEIAVTGREGVVGLEVLLDDVAIPRFAVVQGSGSAMRIRAEVLTQECARSRPLREAFMRYMQALISQMMQLSICNRHHGVQERFCRLLLSRLDRMMGDTVDISHELMASALGTSMHDVTRIAMDFWSAGYIDQGAGSIRVRDRAALEARACDCYQTVRDHYDRLLSNWRAPAGSARSDKVGTMPSLSAVDRPGFEMQATGGE
ncbi:MAG TPA: Crp/Fnr family transcriptional regulator [Gammaproteobacteria bacterium]|jgi:CRP-like cAMP-binding protein|nr:Crp/Fnr family transcriptional regulator [Gammaproteobacteria bacterium]